MEDIEIAGMRLIGSTRLRYHEKYVDWVKDIEIAAICLKFS